LVNSILVNFNQKYYILTYYPTSDILRLTSYLTMVYTIQIRPKRQATFPSSLLDALGVDVGDAVEVTLKGKKAIIKSKKQIALDSLREIQRIVKESGISKKEMLGDLDKQRQEATKKYAQKAP